MVFLYIYIDVRLNCKKRTLSMIYLFSESFEFSFYTIQLYFFYILWTMTVFLVCYISLVVYWQCLCFHTNFSLVIFKGDLFSKTLNASF